MRLPPRTTPTPEQRTYDVVISQAVGKWANGFTVRNQPTGGSEWQVVLLAEALVTRGYSVAVLTPEGAFSSYGGVDYVPFTACLGAFQDPETGEKRHSIEIKCVVLVSERFGQLPPHVDFGRLVYDLHDLPDDRLQPVMAGLSSCPDSAVVVHSPYLAGLLETWPRVSVIPCMVPDEFYDAPTPRGGFNASMEGGKLTRERRYVYGSAAMKGLAPTLQLWAELKKKAYHFKKATLTITSPGYDEIDPELLKGAKDVRVMTGLSPAGMQQLLAASDGIFMVSTYPETFGIVFHQCEIAGKPAWVLRAHPNDDALTTTLANPWTVDASNADELLEKISGFDRTGAAHDLHSAKDFRISTHIDAWIEVLGLKQSKENAA